MKCYNCGKEMKELKCAECSIVDYQCDCGWGSGHSHDHSEVIDSKDLGPTLSALYELDVVKQKLAEKDKEIADWKDGTMLLKIEKETRHQVCEEIRENAYFDHYTDCDGKKQIVYCIEPEKLKEIEQGESK